MMLPKSSLPEGPAAASLYRRLWVHEAFRVFYDRLVDDADRTWLIAQASTRGRADPDAGCVRARHSNAVRQGAGISS